MDLASLLSVRREAADLQHALKINRSQAALPGHDIFLLNAAVAKSSRETVVDEDRASKQTSKLEGSKDSLVGEDGRIEATACVNHVAHLVFISMLVPTIIENAKNGRKTRIVFTGSALHRTVKDSAVLDDFFGGASHSSVTPWNLRETYAASKFLQMLGVRALRRRLEKLMEEQSVPPSMVEIVVVQPGFVPQTGLCRESGLLTRLLMNVVLPWMPFVTTRHDAGNYISDACVIDLPTQFDSQDQDGFHSSQTLVRSAMLEVHAHNQRFGTLDPRTADISLQDKWWPAHCIDL